jgi:hypothetical protein
MATPDQLREMTNARSFQPFLIKMTGGRSFTVKHPENVAWDNRGRAMAIFDDDGTHLVEMLLVEVIETMKSPSGTEGNGA